MHARDDADEGLARSDDRHSETRRTTTHDAEQGTHTHSEKDDVQRRIILDHTHQGGWGKRDMEDRKPLMPFFDTPDGRFFESWRIAQAATQHYGELFTAENHIHDPADPYSITESDLRTRLATPQTDAWHCCFNKCPKNRTSGTDLLTAKSWQLALPSSTQALQSITSAFKNRRLQGPPPDTTSTDRQRQDAAYASQQQTRLRTSTHNDNRRLFNRDSVQEPAAAGTRTDQQ